jgi:hypothetical protein
MRDAWRRAAIQFNRLDRKQKLELCFAAAIAVLGTVLTGELIIGAYYFHAVAVGLVSLCSGNASRRLLRRRPPSNHTPG